MIYLSLPFASTKYHTPYTIHHTPYTIYHIPRARNPSHMHYLALPRARNPSHTAGELAPTFPRDSPDSSLFRHSSEPFVAAIRQFGASVCFELSAREGRRKPRCCADVDRKMAFDTLLISFDGLLISLHLCHQSVSHPQAGCLVHQGIFGILSRSVPSGLLSQSINASSFHLDFHLHYRCIVVCQFVILHFHFNLHLHLYLHLNRIR